MLNLKHLMLGGLLSLSVLTPALGIASADTVDGFTSDSHICTITPELYDMEDGTYSLSDSVLMTEGCWDSENYLTNFCIETSDTPYDLTYYYYGGNYSDRSVSVSSSVVCFDGNNALSIGDNSVYFNKNGTFKIYYSSSSITPPSSSVGDSDSDSSFNSSLYSTISGTLTNYTGSLTNYIPYIIGLGIAVVAILAFRRIIKSWVRRIFRR